MLEPSMQDVFNDIEARFLLMLPNEEFSEDRLFFQLEQAHWFYEDFYADEFHPAIPHMRLQSFARAMFEHSSLLRPRKDMCSQLFDHFSAYKNQVPVFGFVLLNAQRNKFVLIRNWIGKSWSFPKGKLNQGEEPFQCAVREALEETGFDAEHYSRAEDFISIVESGKHVTLFIAHGVPEDTVFEPQTRKEVSAIEWFTFETIPKNTWMVNPFIPKLKRWIKLQKHSRNRSSFPHSASNNFDERNEATFGGDSVGWGVDAMFAANEKLSGRRFVYDGNPHTFADRSLEAQQVSQDTLSDDTPDITYFREKISLDKLFDSVAAESKQEMLSDLKETHELFRFDMEDIMNAFDKVIAATYHL